MRNAHCAPATCALNISCFQDHDLLEKRIFNMYDANRDGHIDFREFVVAMYIMANGSVEDNLKQIFRVLVSLSVSPLFTAY